LNTYLVALVPEQVRQLLTVPSQVAQGSLHFSHLPDTAVKPLGQVLRHCGGWPSFVKSKGKKGSTPHLVQVDAVVIQVEQGLLQ
jgi:hypothetical protein